MVALKESNLQITLHLIFPDLVRMIEILINLKFIDRLYRSYFQRESI